MEHQPQVEVTQTPDNHKPGIESGVRDTIESILVAFMLAFIFRAFVVEAFVIPTGSMATTLLGAHMRFRCPDCGYRFEVNYQGAETGSDDMYIPASAGKSRFYAIFCPNCGYRMPRYNPSDPANDANDPQIHYGDRILVLKYLYLFQQPQRWDVVVFKSPYWPGRYDYSQNYIKRLIGKPGETVMILDGDVYIARRDPSWEPLERQISQAEAELRQAEEAEKNAENDIEKRQAHQTRQQALERIRDAQIRLASKFKVQTKPYKVQESLWRIVYDNDFYPRGLDRSLQNAYGRIYGSDPPWQQPWRQLDGHNGWSQGEGPAGKRNFVFSNLAGSSTLRFDPSLNPLKFALTDWLAYDVTENQGPNSEPDSYRKSSYTPENNVSDVKLSFYYHRQQGDGALRVQLTKLSDAFEAEITPDEARLIMNGRTIAGPAPLPRHGGPILVEMINADYRVCLRIDSRELLSSTEQQYYPDIPALLEAFAANRSLPKPQVQITAEKQRCAISHLSLWRDVYYLNRGIRRASDVPTQNSLWASPVQIPRTLMELGKDEYFVLGDNSFVSLDARFWDDPVSLPSEDLLLRAGRVPGRFMLGKAFFVYWPAGYRPIPSAPAIVPNFGKMRFIH